MIYCFADYELDTGAYELRKAGIPQHLEPQVFDVLAYLLENCDRLVSKEELLDRVWGDRFISEAALNSRIMAARRAIGDDGQEQRLIRTLRGRGFRFVGHLTLVRPDYETGPHGGLVEGQLAGPNAPRPQQEVRFCTAPDGVRIAYASAGQGPVLVKAPNWLTHLDFEWKSPVWRHWWEDLARNFRVIRFDQRGSGLSDRDVPDISFETWINDLETVVEAAGVDRFSLLGISQGGPVAVAYCVRHPERVEKLVLYGAYAQGKLARGESPVELEAILTLIRRGWGRNNPAYRQMFTTQFMPAATAREMDWFNELQRVSTSAENAARIQAIGSRIEVLDLLPKVSVPTLVLHATEDARVPFDQGRLLASMIPTARLVALDSQNHLITQEEDAWPRLIEEVRTFLQS